jgi:protein involved in polysaccharide export with SLBB domain
VRGGVARLAALVMFIAPAAGTARAQMGMAPADPLSPSESAPTRVVTPDTQFPSVLPGAVDPDRYIVGPGDVFQLNFSGSVTRTLWLTVGPEGMMFVPGAGAVSLDGLTLTEARRELARRLATQFHGVDLDLRLARVRTMRVFLTGEVAQPGAADVPAVSRVSEVLPDAVLKPSASRRNIRITRRGGEHMVADLERWNRTGNNVFNPPLRDGDIVTVPVAITHIEIAGAVGRGGGTELGPADSLSTLFELAGGPLPSARAEGCLLVRWKSSTEAESLYFSLTQFARGEFNPPLFDGDHVYVYYTPRFHALEQATAIGELARPGTYPLVSGKTRLSDLVSAAGGFLPRADLSAIRVYRPSLAGHESDPELDRLLRLSRGEMSDAEYAKLQTRLSARHEDFRIDWRRVQESPELDLLMLGGDVVRVEQILSSVRVDGEVRRPGIVAYDPRRSVNSYVRLAGGYGQRAAPGRVLVTRAVTGQTLRARDVPALAPGDLIWVPERPDRSVWQELGVLLAAASQVATIYFVVRK